MKTITIIDTGKKKTSKLLAECGAYWSYLSDAELDKQFPPVKSSRVFEMSQEPTMLGVSAQEGDPDRKGITLRERLLLEIAYFAETGEHLDVVGFTICSGSRDSDGRVPRVCWSPGYRDVYVRWYGLDSADPWCGLRQQFPFNPPYLLPLLPTSNHVYRD